MSASRHNRPPVSPGSIAPCPACGHASVDAYADLGRERPFGRCESCERLYTRVRVPASPEADGSAGTYERPGRVSLEEVDAASDSRGGDERGLRIETDGDRAILELERSDGETRTRLVERPIDDDDLSKLVGHDE